MLSLALVETVAKISHKHQLLFKGIGFVQGYKMSNVLPISLFLLRVKMRLGGSVQEIREKRDRKK